MTRPKLVGLTGARNVGKSSVADLLVERHGFHRAHVFDGGKAATAAFFARYVGASRAKRMVFGDLKDTPCPKLPNGASPRFFMEKFGHFMGAGLGFDWTLGMELDRALREAAGRPIVFESVVYEAPLFQARGGFILRVIRPGHQGPAGVETDRVQAAIAEDGLLANIGSLADLEAQTSAFVDLFERWHAVAA
jgi:hypothetical protein